MRSFYSEAINLANKRLDVDKELVVITINKEVQNNNDVLAFHLQQALKSVYEEGFRKGCEETIKRIKETKKI